MDTKNILQIIQDNDTFLISYYAKKHSKIITRRGTWTKPNTDTQGRHDRFETRANNVCLLGFRRNTLMTMAINGEWQLTQ